MSEGSNIREVWLLGGEGNREGVLPLRDMTGQKKKNVGRGN